MERLNYRETLLFLNERFGGKVVVNTSQVAEAFGIDRRTAKKRYPFNDGKIEITRLASMLCLSKQEIRNAYHLN